MFKNNFTYLPFGVDTIGLNISPLYVNTEMWEKGAFTKTNIKSYNGAVYYHFEEIKKIGESDFITLVKTKNPFNNCSLFSIRIQQEVLYLQMNYLQQVVQILMELAEEGYLIFPQTINYSELYFWITSSLANICSLNRLDLYMDFREEDFIQQNSSITIDHKKINTTYSPDHKQHRSLWACYDRRKKLLDKNQMKHFKAKSLEYPIRLEIRLDLYNFGNYLNLNLLNGTFLQIAENLTPTIAKSWRKYKAYMTKGYNNNTYYNPFFNFIEYWSTQKRIPQTIIGMTL